MPTIFFYGPKLDREKSLELIKGFTRTAAAATGIDESAFVVYLRPVEADRVGVGGEMLEDMLKRRG